MSDSKSRVLQREKERGKQDALNLAARVPELDGTGIIAEEDHIPKWSEKAAYTADMLGWPVQYDGQVYTIQQPHTPAHNPGVYPPDLPAIYFRQNTQDPAKAKPYIAPNGRSGVYIKGDCCTAGGHVWRSTFDGENVWSPTDFPDVWEDLGTVEEVQS